MRRNCLLAFVLCVVAVNGAGAQAPAPGTPVVGDIAPDFTLPIATMEGAAVSPITLSSLKGKTVVLAFYPRARSSGCTIQMKAYRDQYATLFGGGKDVVLLAISTDSIPALASWAGEEKFPFRFVSDVDGVAGGLYGTLMNGRNIESRVLFVIGPDQRIRTIMRPFREIDATAYTDLRAAIEKAR